MNIFKKIYTFLKKKLEPLILELFSPSSLFEFQQRGITLILKVLFFWVEPLLYLENTLIVLAYFNPVYKPLLHLVQRILRGTGFIFYEVEKFLQKNFLYFVAGYLSFLVTLMILRLCRFLIKIYFFNKF